MVLDVLHVTSLVKVKLIKISCIISNHEVCMAWKNNENQSEWKGKILLFQSLAFYTWTYSLKSWKGIHCFMILLSLCLKQEKWV